MGGSDTPFVMLGDSPRTISALLMIVTRAGLDTPLPLAFRSLCRSCTVHQSQKSQEIVVDLVAL